VLKIGDRDINREMAAEGWACQYTGYDKSAGLWDAQAKAERDKLGLWADVHPIPPWKFRKTIKSVK
jgi:micrococcal nuclease